MSDVRTDRVTTRTAAVALGAHAAALARQLKMTALHYHAASVARTHAGHEFAQCPSLRCRQARAVLAAYESDPAVKS